MRRRTYLSTLASGTALTLAGCLGSDDTDDSDDPDDSDGNETDADGENTDGQNNESDGDVDDGPQQLDEPLDVLVENDYDEAYTVEVVITDDSGATVFEDEVDLENDASQRFEDVVSEPGTYTVEATKAGDISRSSNWEVDADSQDVYVHIAENGEYTVEERDVDA
ncbi:hypothetical protein SAMN06269185_2952 [Natronoarchaeum philippinense]|uniref:Ig-like domain-containing protein n=1 Tax=Natronoarchaeum philippinense TaxID=558529 RepID=A0A285P676_NATPI|nr:hypothetical protein [Natronoarchaeum philippinense]SNZ17259.1 hypothetical protein SAMN06269185_2952 [Natronoarchaeum philippinense]